MSNLQEKSFFEQEREALISDIALHFNNILTNLNHLNRSLEAVIAVGNEFSSVEGLWSQFEGVMGKDEEPKVPEGEEEQSQVKQEESDNDNSIQ